MLRRRAYRRHALGHGPIDPFPYAINENLKPVGPLDNLGQLFVLTARAKGASEGRIVTRHVARPALGPVAAMLAVDIAIVVTAAIYVDTVFGLGGIGQLVAFNLAGAQGYDLNVLVGVVVIAVAITTVSLASGLTVRALDSRIHFDGSRAR